MPRRAATLLLLLCGCAAADSPVAPAVAPRVQTAVSLQDAANDVALWVHPSQPERSLVIGAGGTAGIETFTLDGALVQRLRSPQADYVDVRYGVTLDGRDADLVLAVDVPQARLHFFALDAASGQIAPLAGDSVELGAEITGLCSYRSPVTGKLYALVSTDEGDLLQLELYARGGALSARPIRRVPLGRGAGPCVVDDAAQAVFVTVETTGLWRLHAEPESDATPEQLDALAPLGTLDEEITGIALYRVDDAMGYVLAVDVGHRVLRVYDLDGKARGTIALGANGAIPAVGEAEAVALVAESLPGFAGGLLAVADEDNGDAYANYKLVAFGDIATALDLKARQTTTDRAVPRATAIVVEPTVETEPVSTYGDAADDPAIWVHPTDPAQSLIIGANKKLGLEVYDLSGRRVQTLPDGRMNNVDVRDGFLLAGERVALFAASNRTTKAIALYRVDLAARRLVAVELEDAATGLSDPYGVCLYRSARSGRYYLFVNDADSGLMRQWRLDERRGRVRATRVRDVQVGSLAEGCVADDELGWLYVGEEDTGVWKYRAEPDAAGARSAVDSTEGGHLTADVEGMSLWRRADGTGYLVVSNQGEDNYALYRREGENAFVGKFHVVANEELGIDGASETDGLDVTSAPLGAGFEQGVLVVQDGRNLTPTDRQNFKLVPWSRVADAMALPR